MHERPHLDRALSRDDGSVSLVAGLNGSLAGFVRLCMRLTITHHLLDLVLAQAARGLDADALLLVGRLPATHAQFVTAW